MGDFLQLKQLLHTVAQGFLYPTIIILILLILFAVVMIAWVIVEAVVERRHFKVELPRLLASVDAAPFKELSGIIESSGLLLRQRQALHTLVAYAYLPEDARVSLAKRLLAQQEESYLKITSRTDLITKAAPMIGLMGTLIPLGPGVVALGKGDVSLLSSSIEIAFDTTIAGLVVAVVCMVVGRFRKRWYEEYLSCQEAIMSTVLEKARLCLEQGEDLGSAQDAEEYLQRWCPRGAEKGGLAKQPSGKPDTALAQTEAGE